MLDLGHLPTAAPQDVFWFYGNQGSGSTGMFATWTKPRGVTMVQILCLGSGASGASGAVGATAAGGAGGGSGGQSTLIVPASYLPQTLYIRAGTGNTNIGTVVSVRPHGATAASVPVASDQLVMANGSASSTGASAATASNCILSGLGIAKFLAGVNGGAGGSAAGSAAGSPAAVTTGLVVQGGGGGGGMTAAVAVAGGTPASSFPTWLPAATGGAAGTSGVAGGIGFEGFGMFGTDSPRVFQAGGGGGAGFPTATTSNGGNGGDGGYGCGGGGGGGAITGKTAGTGGMGGPGLVIITCW